MTVLVLAIAVNLEPTRFILVPLLLARDKPMLQLLAYVAGSMSVSLAFGLVILFIFHRNPLGSSPSGGARAQILVGALALGAAAIMALRSRRARRETAPPVDTTVDPVASESTIDRFAERVRGLLRWGRSPWLALVLGMGVGIPSVDYLAVLVIIGTSQKPPAEQAAALVTFMILGGLAVMAPLVGYLFAPSKALELLERFANWMRSRSRVEYAGLLALIGCLLIGVGVSHL